MKLAQLFVLAGMGVFTAGLLSAAEMPGMSAVPSGGNLYYDDGKMDDRLALNQSGATVQFDTDKEISLTGVRFYGARYSRMGAVPSTPLVVYVADKDFNSLFKMEYPVVRIPEGRESWVLIGFPRPVKVKGTFFITLAGTGTREAGIYIGLDDTQARGYSRIGIPGSIPTDVDAPYNWMIRGWTAAVTAVSSAASSSAKPVLKPAVKPVVKVTEVNEKAKPVATAAKPKPQSAIVKPNALPAKSAGKVSDKPAAVSNVSKPKPAPKPAPTSTLTYRSPNREVTVVKRAPRLPKGSGRVDVTWSVSPPVTVELSYVGKLAKVLENLSTNRLVVDFPVPEPGLFNVAVIKAGYQTATRQFRVVSGGRQAWRAVLGLSGKSVGSGGSSVVQPVIEDTPSTSTSAEPEKLNDAKIKDLVKPHTPAPSATVTESGNAATPEVDAPPAPALPSDPAGVTTTDEVP